MKRREPEAYERLVRTMLLALMLVSVCFIVRGGALEYWVAVVKPGRVMFEISGVSEEIAREALRLATHKLPIKCKVVSKADLEGGAGCEE